MAYEPTNWKTGDVVTSAKLNKLEQGVAAGSGVLVVHSTYDESTQTVTLDKTWQEIYDASHNGSLVVSTYEGEHGETVFESYMTGIDNVRGYHVFFLSCYYDAATSEMKYERMSFIASGPDAYPATSGQ